MGWLNYHHLLYFHTIAKEGSMVRAAQRLRIGQPALSTQLKQLEQSLGFPLFIRKNRTLVVTEKGRIIQEYAAEIFRLGSEMVEAAADRLSEERIHLQIGALDSLPKLLIHRLVETAYGLGKCYVSVLEGSSDNLYRELKAHRVDLVLTNSPAPFAVNSRFQSRKVAEMQVVICGAPRFSKLRAQFPKSLSTQPFVLPTAHSKLRQDVDHYFESQALKISPIGETQDIEVQKLLALSGHALIPIALPAVKDHLKSGALVKLGVLEHVSEQLWLTSAARRVQNPFAAKLMKTFKIN